MTGSRCSGLYLARRSSAFETEFRDRPISGCVPRVEGRWRCGLGLAIRIGLTAELEWQRRMQEEGAKLEAQAVERAVKAGTAAAQVRPTSAASSPPTTMKSSTAPTADVRRGHCCRRVNGRFWRTYVMSTIIEKYPAVEPRPSARADQVKTRICSPDTVMRHPHFVRGPDDIRAGRPFADDVDDRLFGLMSAVVSSAQLRPGPCHC